MNKTHKKLALIAISAFVVEAALVVGVATNFNASALSLAPIKAEAVSRSMTISKANAISYSSKASATYANHYDNTIVFASATGGTFTCTVTNSTTSISDSSNIGNIYADSSISFSSSYSPASKTFQQVDSIAVSSASTAARTIRFYFNESETYQTLSVPARDSATYDTSTIGTVRCLTITGSSASEYSTCAVTSIVLGYTCDPNYSEDAVYSSLSVDASGAKTEYTTGESLDATGIVVTAHYSDLTQETVSSGYVVTAPDMSTAGEKTVTISYTIGSITNSCSYLITVEEPASGLSGTYAGTYSSFTFTSSTSGSYTYNGNTVIFTYVIDGSSITFTHVSGSNTALGSYMLFDGKDSPVPNSTGVLNSETSISVRTYNPFGGSNLRTFTKS